MYSLVTISLVLGVIALVLRKRSGPAARLNSIKVTSRASMHRGAAIAVVEVDGRRLLVGASTQAVNLIADLGTAESHSHLPALEATSVEADVSPAIVPVGVATDPESFVDRLRRATTRTADPAVRQAARPTFPRPTTRRTTTSGQVTS